jgi:hypothetical protein
MTFPHVDQSSLFNIFVLLHIGQKLHTHPLLFLWLFKCSKKKSKKNELENNQEMKTKIFVFQPIFDCHTILESLKKFLFKNIID